MRDAIPFDPWHKDPLELARLWRWLDDQGKAPDDPAYFMEKAGKLDRWKFEYEAMCIEEAQERLLEEHRVFADDLERRGAL